MATFHVSGAVDPRTGLPRPRNNCSCGCAQRSKASAPVKLNAFEQRLRRTWLAELKSKKAKSLPSPGKAPSRQPSSDMRPAASAPRLLPRPAPYHQPSPRDRERARAFMPETTMLGILARTNPAAAVRVASAMAERRLLTTKAANYEPALPGRPQYMSDRDRQRAAEFAHLPSSLDVWRAQQSHKAREMSPEDDLVHENPGMAGDARKRDFEKHQAEMRAIATGKKPATRAAPKSDRGGYRG